MLNDHGIDQNEFYWAWKRVAKEDVRIKQLVGPDPRFRVILASHVSGYNPPGTILKKQSNSSHKYFGPPNQFLYAVACAPYFGCGRDENESQSHKMVDRTPGYHGGRHLRSRLLSQNRHQHWQRQREVLSRPGETVRPKEFRVRRRTRSPAIHQQSRHQSRQPIRELAAAGNRSKTT